MLRKFTFLFVLATLAVAASWSAPQARAEETAAYRGLWASTDYPAQTVAPGKPATLEISIHNAGLPPQIVALATEHTPEGWKAELLGGGSPVRSVFVGPDSTARVTLRLTPPEEVAGGAHEFVLTATGENGRFRLPLSIEVGDVAPVSLKLESELPELRGGASSNFDFKLSLTNSGGKDVTVRLDVGAPQGFRAAFRERYGSQELTSIPLKAGEKRDLSLKVDPPRQAEAGVYQVEARAATAEASAETVLKLDVTGRPELSLAGADDRLSGDAQAGSESALDLVLVNNGSAPATDVKLSSSEPSGWKIRFEPAQLASLAPGQDEKIKALVTPSAEAIAGDYQVSMRASGGDGSASSNFRITVRTSTLWGAAGMLTIAASLGVLGIAVVRYGRR